MDDDSETIVVEVEDNNTSIECTVNESDYRVSFPGVKVIIRKDFPRPEEIQFGAYQFNMDRELPKEPREYTITPELEPIRDLIQFYNMAMKDDNFWTDYRGMVFKRLLAETVKELKTIPIAEIRTNDEKKKLVNKGIFYARKLLPSLEHFYKDRSLFERYELRPTNTREYLMRNRARVARRKAEYEAREREEAKKPKTK